MTEFKNNSLSLILIPLLVGVCANAWGSIPHKTKPPADKLNAIQAKIMVLESEVLSALRTEGDSKTNLKRMKALAKLQQQEREISRKRLVELEQTIHNLESRRGVLTSRIKEDQSVVRQRLRDLEQSMREGEQGPGEGVAALDSIQREKIEAPRRRALTSLVESNLKEIEAYQVDLSDADHLEERIGNEKQQLVFLFQDLKEKEGVLELNRQLQVDLIQKKHKDRVHQFENYRKLKVSEAQVETLIHSFSARMELDDAMQTEKRISQEMHRGEFAKWKGNLGLPVANGKVLTLFGRFFDPTSKLYVFKKGVDISGGKKKPVIAVFSGKVAYSGELSNYGRVAIVDHGGHYYSLCAHLGATELKVGSLVKAGDTIGMTDNLGTPIYFEIRSRNVPVNPLQWISN